MKLTRNALLICVASVAPLLAARADMVVDRGLPTANLNNTAGNNRANVSWADQESSSSPSEYWLPGDDFTIGGSGTYQVNTIRIWTTGGADNLSLRGGIHGANMGLLSSSYTATAVQYLNGQTYQGSSGGYSGLYQVDFNVNFSLAGGQTFDFFVDGPWSAYAGGGYANTFLHASNAGLSGSTQQGSDGMFSWLHINGTGQAVETWFSGNGGGTSGWGAGWDKNSDANIQVFAAPVPEPATMIAGALLLIPFGASALRRIRK